MVDVNKTSVRHPHPKIMLIDLDEPTRIAFASYGFNVVEGELGRPYKVEMSDKHTPIITDMNLPYYQEKEIVVINLAPFSPLNKPSGKIRSSSGEKGLWASCAFGIVDPRLVALHSISSDSQRILEHGGIFIVFAAAPAAKTFAWGHSALYQGLQIESEIEFNNYGFLDDLRSEYFVVERSDGNEIVLNPEYLHTHIVQILAQYIGDAEYECTFHISHSLSGRWMPLAKNKFEAPVAGILFPPKEGGGFIFLFPRIKNKAGLLKQLLEEYLPSLAPKYFPHLSPTAWVREPEYEHAPILSLHAEIRAVEQEARQQIAQREAEIERVRAERQYLHDLITEDGDLLVEAVKTALTRLGFKDIKDMDAERAKFGDTSDKREDLQIADISPTLLVEIKGKKGMSAENDALQIVKNINSRMRQWDRTDVRGLSIINHQRGVPALKRENASPFQPDVIITAEDQKIGLLTTWDLFRLVHSFEQNQWTHENIQSLFYQNGRVEIVPAHYELLGVIERFYPNHSAVSIEIQQGSLKCGDWIAFELPVTFEEEEVNSIRDDNNPVSEMAAGSFAGIQTRLSKEQARKGVRVYRIAEKAPAPVDKSPILSRLLPQPNRHYTLSSVHNVSHEPSHKGTVRDVFVCRLEGRNTERFHCKRYKYPVDETGILRYHVSAFVYAFPRLSVADGSAA